MITKMFGIITYDDYERQDEIEFTSRALAEEFCDCYGLSYDQIYEIDYDPDWARDFYRRKEGYSIYTGATCATKPFHAFLKQEMVCSNRIVIFFRGNQFGHHEKTKYLDAPYIVFTVEATSEDDAKRIVNEYVEEHGWDGEKTQKK
jgi:hypothetical protein